MNEYINLNLENIDEEHLCCAIGDPKHREGVDKKKEWIKSKLKDGHIFRKLNARGKIFIEYEPIETEIKKYQEDYYKVIQNCNNKGESTEFIEFMLKMIDEVLDGLIEKVNMQINHISVYVKKLLDIMEYGVNYTTTELMELLDMKSRNSFRENYLGPALDSGIVKMSFPDNPTSKNQTYYKC